MHLLVMFFDYLLVDGSHGFTKYGWKFIPLCILHSGGKTLPVACVFGLEEDSQALNSLLVSLHCHKSSCECTLYLSSQDCMRQHVRHHGVDCNLFKVRDQQETSECTL